MSARWKLARAVEDADVVETQEASGEEVFPLGVLPVDPPGGVDQERLEDARQKVAVSLSLRAADLVDAPGRPGVHGRVDVAEGPLVGRNLAVGMRVPLAQQEQELLLGKLGID